MHDVEEDKKKIREVIETWISATKAGDLDRVLGLMAEDVVFLRPGHEPMRGRAAYAEASRPGMGKMEFDGRPEVQEIHVSGDMAVCWNHLSITMRGEGMEIHQAGHILSMFRRKPDGGWELFRDANLLTKQ